MPQNNGVYLQNWMLSGAAMAYLKVRNSQLATAEQEGRILRWFSLVGTRVRDYFDLGRTRPGSDAWNNHMYWAGLAVAAEGIACNDQNAFLWGMAAYRMGVNAIQPDGSLVAEMNRAGMAEHYPLYALGALVMLAELAAANGIDVYSERDGAIHRLVKFSVAGREDPRLIEKRTGVRQNLPEGIGGLEIGWAVPYGKRFPDERLSALLAKAQWTGFWQWGGAPPEARSTTQSQSPEDQALTAQLERSLKDDLSGERGDDKTLVTALLGEWCAQGDSAKHASVRDSDGVVALTNELGATSTGEARGRQQIVAPGWDFVTGTLSPDGSQIDWSDGRYWARCANVASGARRNLAGTWYPQGVRTLKCTIRQHGDRVRLDNGEGAKGTGRIESSGVVSSEWNGTLIKGTVTPDGNRINWDNLTYWTRARIYDRQKD